MLKKHPRGLLVAFFANMGGAVRLLYNDGNPGALPAGEV